MAQNTISHGECHESVHVKFGQPITSALMFSAGVVGNIAALVLLEVRRRMSSPSLYHVLVTALLVTDLLGSISVSPVVLSAYARNKTLVAMSAGGKVCSYFGFSMTFLSLSTLTILWAVALERYLSIGHPFFYERHLSKRVGYITIAVVYLGSALFSVVPFMGVGEYVQYCPGTWCFLNMSLTEGGNNIYIGFYASFIFITASSTVVFNISVICHLVSMHRRHKVHRRHKARRSGVSARPQCRRSLSMTEEVEHLLPLAVITVVYICCTFPLALVVYINITGNHEEQHAADLGALRLLSFHSILNPWVMILRPSVLKILWKKLHKPEKSIFTRRETLGAHPKQAGSRLSCTSPEEEKRRSQ